MNFSQRSVLLRIRHSVVLLLTIAFASGTSRGEITIAEFNGAGDFSYAVEHMSDLDQRRRGLGENDGSMYCVPTSATNLIAYAANFGFPELGPGPGVWEGATGHEWITEKIRDVADEMRTQDDTGTSGSGYRDGIELWIGKSAVPDMNWVSLAKSAPNLASGQLGYWPTVDTGAYLGSSGSVVNVCFGRYDYTEGFPMPWDVKRQGGHCVTLQRAVANNGLAFGPRAIGFRNPGTDDEDLDLNSTWLTNHMTSAENFPVSSDLDKDGAIEVYTVTSLLNPPPGNQLRIIDGVAALQPPSGVAYTGVQINAQFATGGLGFMTTKAPTVHDSLEGETFLAVTPHPELHSAIALAACPNEPVVLVQLPHGNENAVPLLTFSEGTRMMALGYGHAVYVSDGSELSEIHVQTRSASRGRSTALSRTVQSASIEAMAYDELLEQLYLTSGSKNRLFVFDTNLKLVSAHEIEGHDQQPVRSMVVLGGLLLAAFEDGSVRQTFYRPDARVLRFTRQDLPDVKDALSVDLGNSGRLYVADRDAGVKEFDVQQSNWAPATRPLYAKFKLKGRRFAVCRHRSNIIRAYHDTPEWHNIPANELTPLGEEIAD